jgi:hypothetical protein
MRRAALGLAMLAGAALSAAPASADMSVSCHIASGPLRLQLYATYPSNAPPEGLVFNNGQASGAFLGMPESSGDYLEIAADHFRGGEFRTPEFGTETGRRTTVVMRMAAPVGERRLEVTIEYRGRALGPDEELRGSYVATLTEPRAGGAPRVRTSRGRATCSFGV